jgi:hypothetical protein
VIGDFGPHALHAGVEHLHVLVDLAGDDGGRRLVDLDVIRAGHHQGLELGVDGGDEVPAQGQAIVVVGVARPGLDMDGQRHWPRAGGLDREIGLGLEVLEVVHEAEALADADLRRRPVAGHAVVGVEARLAQRLEGLQALHPRVEGLHEEEAPHLAVADDVDAGPLLVADSQLGGVVERLLDVRLAVVAGLDAVQRRPEPAGETVASHHVSG